MSLQIKQYIPSIEGFMEVDSFSYEIEEEGLINFIRSTANNLIRENLTKVYLLSDVSEDLKKNQTIGYFSLHCFGYGCDIKGNYDYYPCVELSNFFIDLNKRMHGFGRIMMYEVFKIVCDLAKNVGCNSLVAFSLNEDSTAFYKKLDFIEADLDNDKFVFLPDNYHDDELKFMMIPISIIEEKLKYV